MLRIAWNSSGVPTQEEFSFDLLSHLQRIEARPQELEGEFEMAFDNRQEPEFESFLHAIEKFPQLNKISS